jgi:hypothetical protein
VPDVLGDAPMVAAFYDDPESVPEAELRSMAGHLTQLAIVVPPERLH